MRRRVSPEALKLSSELTQGQGRREKWWVCDEYELRDREIVARYSLPWMRAPDSPPWTGREEFHWITYEPLEESPDLFLKLARLHQEPRFEEAVLAFSHRYGVLGGNSIKGRFPKPYKDDLRNFREEAKRAWTILNMYEAALNGDWMAAKSLLIADEVHGGEGHWTFEDSPEVYLLMALHQAASRVADTVKELCRPELRFGGGLWACARDPSSIEHTWAFDNLLGATYLQMYWLMTSGSKFVRCEYCGQAISLAKPHPEGRKRRRDRRFCDDACRQANRRSKQNL